MTVAIRSLVRDDNEPDPQKRYKAMLDGCMPAAAGPWH